ncbi:MAG: sugar phosphate nucleotidyltransferase [Promethearchaeota archaeon]
MKIIGPMAGVGARLRPFTYSKPKGLLKVAGKRVIDHILDLFLNFSSKSTDVLIITGYRNRTIEKHLEERYRRYFNLEFIIQNPKGYRGDMPYYGGLGEAIYISKNWYESRIKSYDSKDPNDIAIIFLSDMVPLDGFEEIFGILSGKATKNNQSENLADDFKDNNLEAKKENIITKSNYMEIDGIIGVMKVPKERASSYGILIVDEKTGLIKKMVEKPKEFISNIAIAGVYAFKPKAMEKMYYFLEKEVERCKNSEKEAQFTPALQNLVKDGFKLTIYEFRKGILDFGNPETLLEGNQFLLKQQDNVLGGPINSVNNSVLISPSYIGKNVVIKNCVVGPYCSIGDNCILKNCIIKNCVIGDECNLDKIITSNSIIGDFVIMDDLIKDNLIIGDNSNIRSSKKNL